MACDSAAGEGGGLCGELWKWHMVLNYETVVASDGILALEDLHA